MYGIYYTKLGIAGSFFHTFLEFCNLARQDKLHNKDFHDQQCFRTTISRQGDDRLSNKFVLAFCSYNFGKE